MTEPDREQWHLYWRPCTGRRYRYLTTLPTWAAVNTAVAHLMLAGPPGCLFQARRADEPGPNARRESPRARR
jgi:hypothetical protein